MQKLFSIFASLCAVAFASMYFSQRSESHRKAIASSPDAPIVTSIKEVSRSKQEPNEIALRSLYAPFLNATFSEKDYPAFAAALPYREITIQRTMCYGDCPAYQFAVNSKGDATYTAEKNLPQLGTFKGKVSLENFARLCYVLDHLGFLRLEDKYSASWTDDSTCIVTVRSANGEKRVSDYGNVGPIQLWLIQQVLDRARDEVAWK